MLALPWGPHPEAARLAALFHLPRDGAGFLRERRERLRPGQARDDGVYVIGGLHQPAEPDEVLLQAYLAGARAGRFLNQGTLPRTAPEARGAAELCTGCAACVPSCPWSAISLQARPGVLSLAQVDARRCTSCGNCAAACPVKAIDLPGAEDAALLAQIEAALAAGPRVLVFACEWSAYAAADLAGARRQPYPAETRLIRLGCSARLAPDHILWAFLNGAPGVLVGVCPAGECHHGAGNRWAAERVALLQRQLAERGLDPRRLRLEHLPGDDGRRFAEVASAFAAEVSPPPARR
ncbi:MAG: hydrogenase iron-sulfur subunit [Anaerolineales bacterium]|nr:hydrogenase iron-sulfur subunit [Anaerolineales bacterium]